MVVELHLKMEAWFGLVLHAVLSLRHDKSSCEQVGLWVTLWNLRNPLRTHSVYGKVHFARKKHYLYLWKWRVYCSIEHRMFNMSDCWDIEQTNTKSRSNHRKHVCYLQKLGMYNDLRPLNLKFQTLNMELQGLVISLLRFCIALMQYFLVLCLFFFLGIETHILSYFVLEALINFATIRDQNYENWLDSLRNIRCWTLEQC